jgi:hypothetical protein
MVAREIVDGANIKDGGEVDSWRERERDGLIEEQECDREEKERLEILINIGM